MNGRAYYNEIDPFAAAWLRELIARDLIAPGDVDERSIVDVRAYEVRNYTQCHFFAGIGGWSLALRLAGWHDDRPVWTGSCPCQPFSSAGKGEAANDERHLWPRWLPLIAECRPLRVFGEQVEAAVGWGWLDVVFSDLETIGYACGATVFPSASVGAPHIRQRLWFVANAESGDRKIPILERGPQQEGSQSRGRGGVGILADADSRGWQGLSGQGQAGTAQRREASHWSDAIWLPCADGKARPTKPGIFPLAHGVPNRVGTLRGAGNAINPEQGAAFIEAYLDHERELAA